MEKKLTIKELAPYLPYGLKVCNGADTFEVTAMNNRTVFFKGGLLDFNDIKPLLRPLSRLTEEIEHNSISIQLEPSLEKVKPSELIYKHWFYTIRENGHFSYHIGDGTAIGSLYGGVPYSLIELLIEWHFDVFGLIGRGLALPIDVKEVKTSTCGYCDSEFSKGTGGTYGEYGEVCTSCYIGLS